METYTFLREFADSWFLIAMFGFFICAILWILRPGANAIHRDASHIPLRDDDDTLTEEPR